MTPEEAARVLAVCMNYEPRLQAPDERAAALRLSLWVGDLADIDYTFAMNYARRWALQEHPPQIVIRTAEFRRAWQQEQDRQAQPPPPGERRPITRADLERWLQGVNATWDERAEPGDEPVRAGAMFASLIERGGFGGTIYTPTPEEEYQERRCSRPECDCPHTECRRGWLEDEVIIIRNGIEYPKVVKCPRCQDSLDVFLAEQAEMRRPSRRRY